MRTGGEARSLPGETECRERIMCSPPFQGLSRDTIIALAAGATCRSYAKGQTILGPCDKEGALFLMIAGSVYLCDLEEDGTEVIFCRFEANDLFGFSFLDSAIVPAGFPDIYVRAGCKGADVVRLRLGRVRAAMLSSPDLALLLSAAQGRSMRRLARNELRLMSGSVRRKPASLLLDLAADDPRGRVHETHEELAKMIGATRQQVTETLCAFRREGLIAYVRCGPIDILASERALRQRMSEI